MLIPFFLSPLILISLYPLNNYNLLWMFTISDVNKSLRFFQTQYSQLTTGLYKYLICNVIKMAQWGQNQIHLPNLVITVKPSAYETVAIRNSLTVPKCLLYRCRRFVLFCFVLFWFFSPCARFETLTTG